MTPDTPQKKVRCWQCSWRVPVVRKNCNLICAKCQTRFKVYNGKIVHKYGPQIDQERINRSQRWFLSFNQIKQVLKGVWEKEKQRILEKKGRNSSQEDSPDKS